MKTISLNGAWEFREANGTEWLPATVPGCNYLDLMALHRIEDPFYGDNEKKALWVSETDWEYRRSFTVPESFCDAEEQLLVCERLDTVCDVFINGICVGRGENSHRAYRFPVKAVLRPGENSLRILFHSPMAYVRKKQKEAPMPFNVNNEVTGIPHIRKAQCDFGWDWGPLLPYSGVCGEIRLEARRIARLAEITLKQEHENGCVLLHMEAASLSLCAAETRLQATVLSPQGTLLFQREQAGDHARFDVSISKPELWWTAELSGKREQPLYTVTLTLLHGGEILETQEKKIGLRTLELNQERDRWGQNFQFILNGVPIFAKGGDWIPPDSFPTRFTPELAEKTIERVRDSNMNMLRIWGGGSYGSDVFYDLCDRYGLLIWQDFMFACEPYPFYNETFLQNVKEEIRINVTRLRHHASLCLWCGNNEIEAMSGNWRTYRRLMDGTEQFFYHILPKWLKRLDPATPYIPGTPCGNGYLSNVGDDSCGDTHLWQVWHGYKPLYYYRKRHTRFCSEFGLESAPHWQTLEEFIAPGDRALNSQAMGVHQKCRNGNNKMLYYMASRFFIPQKFEDLCTLTQLIQSEGVRDATEHWRRNRGRCNGSLWWQLNDCWPVNSWSSIDYRGRFKALQYAAKHFFAPVTVSLEDCGSQVRFFVINDKPAPFDGMLKIHLRTFDGKHMACARKPVHVDGLTAPLLSQKDFSPYLKKHGKGVFLQADLLDGQGAMLSRRTLLFAPEKALSFPKTPIQTTLEVHGAELVIRLKSEGFVRFLQLDLQGNSAPFSDNFFDLLPGEEKRVALPLEAPDSVEHLRERLRLRSLADMEPKGGRLSDAVTRLKIRLLPGYRA